ncbi:hypothetical protein Tco_0730343 [Tanacetum coccineum]|uniref:Uncharacterized protein n=1 Tax=Tanacetum coccineum TaxID=301880 RepID=A0ABQ4YSD3_9ASTR
MGRSKTYDHYKRKACKKIRMGICSVQIRSSMNNQLKGRKVFPRRMLLRNSQKETPFSLTYGSKAIILVSENNVAKDDRGRIKEVDKRRERKEVASIEEAYYQNKLVCNGVGTLLTRLEISFCFHKTTQEACRHGKALT